MLGLTLGDWELAKDVSEWIEIVAIATIVIGLAYAFAAAARRALRDGATSGFELFKVHMARALLLGLDLLIAADIIRTVTLEPTLDNVAALGLLVVVRTFLTWTLIVEAEERWPWQPRRNPPR